MNRIALTVVGFGLWVLLSSAVWGVTSRHPTDDFTYIYFDDFTTEKVMTDSYQHSEIFYYQPPDIFLDGVLVLWPGYGPGLGFLQGFLVDAYAFLRYQFPLGAVMGYVDTGTVGVYVYFDGPFPGQFLDVGVSYDGQNWQTVGHITSSGHHEYSLSPPDSCAQVFLDLRGDGLVLCTLSVHLDMSEAEFICGDADGDGAGPNVVDLIYLVDYLFFDGPPPPVLEAANVDGQGGVNVADLIYLVDYLFFDGPAPICGPIE